MGLLSIYKPGQGYWTRMLTACGAAAVVLAGVGWGWQKMSVLEDPIMWQAGMAVAVVAVFGGLLFYLLNKPSIVDFMIATEIEMKKVHWPNRKEIIGSTLVVIWGTAILALFLFAINLAFGWFFLEIGVLESGAA